MIPNTEDINDDEAQQEHSFPSFVNQFCGWYLQKLGKHKSGLEKDKLKTLADLLLKRENCQKEVKKRSVYLGGIVYTVDINNDSKWDEHAKEAIVVDDGVIIYVGSNCDAEEYTWHDPCVKDVKVYDLDGQTVLPGIHDVDMHPLEARSPVVGCTLPSSTGPEDENMRKALEKCTVKQKGTE